MKNLFRNIFLISCLLLTVGAVEAQAQTAQKVKFKRETSSAVQSAQQPEVSLKQNVVIQHVQYLSLSDYNALSAEMKTKVQNNPTTYVYPDGVEREKAALQRKQGVPSLIVPSPINSPSKK
jgi:hypothetical protein